MPRFANERGGGWVQWALAVALVAQAVTLWALFAAPRGMVWLISPIAAVGLFSIATVYVRFVMDRAGVAAEPGETPSSPPEAPPKSVAGSQPTRILLAEDGEDNQVLISTFLKQAGWEVAVAANGVEAVRLASWQSFDLVLMDVQMPEMDGYQATRELRRAGYAKPIVALTADTRPETRQKCLEAGCTEYLTKPVERKRLLASCRRFLEADADLGAAERAPLRSVLAGDPRIARVLDGFISRLPQRVKQFEECIATGDLARLKHAVHNLKGAGAGYGFEPLSESATRVEEALRAHKSLDAVRGQIDELIALIRRVEGYGEPRQANSAELAPA